MTDADRALAQIKAALDAGPTPGPWDAFHKHKYDEWHVSVPLPRGTMRLALFTDGCPTERPQADAEYIAACNPSNMRAIVAHIDAQAAEIEQARRTADYWKAEHLAGNAEIERLRADAERYREWLRGGPNIPPESSRWRRWEVRYWDGRYWQTLFGDDLDAAIDEARKA